MKAGRCLLRLACLGLWALGSAARAQAGDSATAERLFLKCRVCHSLVAGEHAVGPSLHGILDRPIATAPGFRYSNAALKSSIVWNRQSLAEFLRDPQAKLPGNRMAFPGLDDAAEIELLIDFLVAR
jgi:cytochrome c